MLDPKFIREHAKDVKDSLKKRGIDIALVDEYLKDDERYRKLKEEVDSLRHKRNVISEEINILKKSGKSSEAGKKILEAKSIPERIKAIEIDIEQTEKKVRELLLKIPNIPAKDVPFGKSSEDNKVIRRWGKPTKFKFKAKDHLELAKNLGIIDDAKAAEVSGNGFFYLKEELALLDLAIQRFAIDFLRKRGYKLIEPPFMMHKKAMEGAVSLAGFDEMVYKIQDDDLYLIGTAEHALAAIMMNETILESEMPLKFIGLSSCYRKEVGSHGKYTKGLFRMHQFNKVEQFIFCKPQDSWKMFDELQKNSEDMFKALKIPFRTVVLCTGDMGFMVAKTYDIEVWTADNQYREVGSNSNCTDFQARRLNIKYKEKEGQTPKGLVHTLNNTGLATSRVMVAILENYQQKDGSIKVPNVLQKYAGFKIIKPIKIKKIETKKKSKKVKKIVKGGKKRR